METYDTLTSAIAGLRKKGYELDFNIAFDKIMCQQNGICLNPDQFEITEHFRFEGNSNPDDSDILFAIESRDGTMKGLLVDAYGAYGDPLSDDLIRKLAVRE